MGGLEVTNITPSKGHPATVGFNYCGDESVDEILVGQVLARARISSGPTYTASCPKMTFTYDSASPKPISLGRRPHLAPLDVEFESFFGFRSAAK